MSMQQESNAVAIIYQQLSAGHYADAVYWRDLGSTPLYDRVECAQHATYHQKRGAFFSDEARELMGIDT